WASPTVTGQPGSPSPTRSVQPASTGPTSPPSSSSSSPTADRSASAGALAAVSTSPSSDAASACSSTPGVIVGVEVGSGAALVGPSDVTEGGGSGRPEDEVEEVQAATRTQSTSPATAPRRRGL